MGLDFFAFGKKTNPAGKITSAIVSLGTLLLLYMNIVPKYEIWLYLFLVLHILNYIYLAIVEIQEIPCPSCSKKNKRATKKKK